MGDACLFHTRGEALLQATPLDHSRGFTHTFWLLGSPHQSALLLEKKLQRARGSLQPGDALWLMTDALAHWFLGEIEHARSPVPWLESVLIDVGACAFADWIESRRQSGTLRNDDVTLVALRWSGG